LNKTENVHGHWLIHLEQQEHALLGIALHFIRIIWITLRLC